MKTYLFAAVYGLFLTGMASAGTAIPAPVATPALAPWGMVGSAAALGLSGLYFLIRRNK